MTHIQHKTYKTITELPLHTSDSEMAEGGRLPNAERARNMLLRDAFQQNAFHIFNKALELSSLLDCDCNDLLDPMLHSILFLGNIHLCRCPPDVIFANEAIYERIHEDFQGPFERYKDDVPQRTPFSYFLELVVRCLGESNEDEVKGVLGTIFPLFNRSGYIYPLISSVICICQTSELSKKYYGCSLTCSDEIVREIMTAISCLHVWHPYVSSAVLGVFPDDTNEAQFPDGTITLPDSVRCRAYAIKNITEVKAPCKRCHELYSLPNPSGNRNKPGNCAETETLSNLFKNERGVENNTTIHGVLLERHQIEERMRNLFETKMRERMNEHGYNINAIYVYE